MQCFALTLPGPLLAAWVSGRECQSSPWRRMSLHVGAGAACSHQEHTHTQANNQVLGFLSLRGFWTWVEGFVHLPDSTHLGWSRSWPGPVQPLLDHHNQQEMWS